ncbi:MAG TPA: D-alanyl-D-alanine carboxypeptidase [Thermoanaerobaculia bacterium]|nr:D-alanyl-D-alanine carboxypeptidase [Thermoanaerobaculia bacterium]
MSRVGAPTSRRLAWRRLAGTAASRRRFAALTLAVLLTACATAPPPPSLPSRIDAAIDRPTVRHAYWSILVEEADGRVLYEHNADKLNMPASNRKVFAAATIANCLGLETRLQTEIWRDGEDLVLRGDGDPSLGSWRYYRENDFDVLAQQLRAQGVTRVRDVIADVSLFDRITIPGSWKHGNIGSDYAAPVDALTWGESEVPVDRAVPDSGLHAANALREALLLRDVEVTGTTRLQTEPRVWPEKLAVLPSPFVSQLLTTVLKNSHNLYTEMLLKRAGGGTYERAFALERELLTRELAVNGEWFRFVDGSGLAPDDLVTPRATVKALRWMHDPVRRGFWWSVLAQPASEGTLRRRLLPLEQRLRGKTGTINGVNALSGILEMPGGGFRYFCVVVNHHAGDADAVAVIDEIVRMVAE